MRPRQIMCIWLLTYILSIYSNNVFNASRTYGFPHKTRYFAEVHIIKTHFVQKNYILLTKLLQNAEGKNVSLCSVSVVTNCFSEDYKK